MERYRKLRLIRDQIVLLPGLISYKDFDISVEVGHYECLGTPLTLKRLLLLEIASEATVRRHLNMLIQKGFVVKTVNPDDRRCVVLNLTDKAHKLFDQTLNRLVNIMEDLNVNCN